MNAKETVCAICKKPIQVGQPRFYFPRLPEGHSLGDLHGVLHVSCLREADQRRSIGSQLAEISAGLASRSESAPLLLRNGNVVVRDREEENRVEILDFEGFCEVSIPRAVLGMILRAEPGEAIPLGMQVLHITSAGGVEIETKASSFVTSLPSLDLGRLRGLAAQILDVTLGEC